MSRDESPTDRRIGASVSALTRGALPAPTVGIPVLLPVARLSASNSISKARMPSISTGRWAGNGSRTRDGVPETV